jgi:hypothetical protein
MAARKDTPDDQYSEQEAQRRTEAALRAAFNSPPKPQSEMKLGKSKSGKSSESKVAAGEAMNSPALSLTGIGIGIAIALHAA